MVEKSFPSSEVKVKLVIITTHYLLTGTSGENDPKQLLEPLVTIFFTVI